MDCIKRSNIQLKKHQINAIKFLQKKGNDGLILVHPTGYGKTLTAVAYSQCFLDKYPKQKVIFVGPSSLLSNFKKELKKYGVKNLDNYEIYSYKKFMLDFPKNSLKCKENLLIVDEAHNLRGLVPSSDTKGMMSKFVFKCSIIAKKRLLLTATPYFNDLEDFEALINLVYGAAIINRKNKLKYAEDLPKYLKNKLDFIRYSPKDKKLFPTFKEQYVSITMPKEYEKKYCQVLKGQNIEGTFFSNPSTFYNAHRRAVNKIGLEDQYLSLKIKEAINIIGKNKSLLYSNWLSYGLEPIIKELKRKGIKSKVFSGEFNEKEKKEIVDKFNNDEFQVLIISSAGKEGLDLKGVRKLIIMDPVWNFAGMEQIKGRAIRLGSHLHLPEKDRHVDIYYLLLTTSGKDKGCISGDSLVYRFVKDKEKIQKKIDKILRHLSINK